MLVTNQIME